MIDTYLKSKNKEALAALNGSVINMLPIHQGQAVQVVTGESGEETILPAVGDPEYFYTCVRAVFPIPAFGEVELSNEEEAAPVCGVWA